MAGNGVPKQLFLYWHQGWDRAPELVKRCAATWPMRNPSWNVSFLDRIGIERKVFIPHAAKALNLPLPAFSDVVRLCLLRGGGGGGGYGRMPPYGVRGRWTIGSNPLADRRASLPMKSRCPPALSAPGF